MAKLIMLIGIQGSGKTTYSKKLMEEHNAKVISTDRVRQTCIGIEEKDVLELVVISNPKTVKIPDFTGWHYKDLIKYSIDNNINFIFEYVILLYPANYAVGQSVEAGSMVLKNVELFSTF